MSTAPAPTPPRRRLRLPLGTVLAGVLAGIMALAVGLMLLIGVYSAGANTRELLRDKADAEVDLLAAEIAGLLEPVEAQARFIARRFAEGTMETGDPAFERLVDGALAATPQIFGVGILLPGNRLQRVTRDLGPMQEIEVAPSDGIDDAIAAAADRQEPFWDEPFIPVTVGRVSVSLRTPLRRGGELKALMVQVVRIADLSQSLAARAGGTATPFVLYGRDQVLAHPLMIDWRPLPGEEAPLPSVAEIADAPLAALSEGAALPMGLVAPSDRSTVFGREMDGERFYFVTRDLDQYGPEPWTIGVHLPSDTAETQIVRVQRTLAVGAGLLVLAVGAGVAAGRLISRPTRRIADLAKLVHDKRLDDIEPLPRSRLREFDDSAAAFNRMVRGMRDRTRVRRMFGRYMPEAVAEAVLKDGDDAMAPQTATASVLFVDLQGFTSMTERLGPVRTVEVLNAYFSAMVAIIERHKGVVTQFQGDAILAIFNVPVADPDHAANAIAAGREMIAQTDTGRFAGESLVCRVGVNTGPLVAGHVGAEGRLNYTVHGDAVNVAARLEGMNKDFGTRLLVADATVDAAGDSSLRAAGEVPVRGHSEPVRVYTLPDGA